MSTDINSPVFLFEMEALQVDPSGYKLQDWSKATPVSVVESTCDLANEKCRAMLGRANLGMSWNTIINSVKEIY